KSLNIFFLTRERPVVGLVFLCHEVSWGQDIHSERFPLYRLRIFRHRVCAEYLDVVHRRVGAVMDLNAIACCRLTVSTTAPPHAPRLVSAGLFFSCSLRSCPNSN